MSRDNSCTGKYFSIFSINENEIDLSLQLLASPTSQVLITKTKVTDMSLSRIEVGRAEISI